MARLAAGLLLALVVASCAGPGWSGPNLHQVDGYWLGTETPCDLHFEGLCEVDVHAALAKFGDAATAGFVSGFTAQLPVWRRADGGILLRTSSGMLESSVVVLDLGEDGRHVVGLVCEKAVWDFDVITRARECWPSDDVIAPYAVGAATPEP